MCCVIENIGSMIENLANRPPIPDTGRSRPPPMCRRCTGIRLRFQTPADRDPHRCVVDVLEFRIASFVGRTGLLAVRVRGIICPTGSRPQFTHVLTSPGNRRLYKTTKAGIKIQVYSIDLLCAHFVVNHLVNLSMGCWCAHK